MIAAAATGRLPARRRRGLRVALALGVGAALLVGSGTWYVSYLARQPLALAEERTVVVAPGMTLTAAVDAFAAAGVQPRWLLALRARQRGLEARLPSGEYELIPGESMDGLLGRLAAGAVLLHPLLIVEGSTARDLLARLAADDRVAFDLEGATPANLMPRLGLAGHAEGRFFPDTYRIPRGARASTLLRQAQEKMDAVLASVWQQRDEGLGLDTAYQALILASLVEKETGVAADRRRVAGVFLRRLGHGMRLQSDPTVIYGLGDRFDGDLTRAHLAQDGPYNTYRRHGLPPTPIALPSRAALEAAVDPTTEAALYFVARGDGTSHFSATLAEHNDAVRRYQLR